MSQSRAVVVSVGIDVSKRTLDVALLGVDHTYLCHTFANAAAGSQALGAWLTKHGVAKATPCILESTGDYHLQTSVTLTSAGYAVNVINPLITKHYQRASIRGAKTDTIDAKRLAQIGLLEPNLRLFRADLAAISHKKILSLLATLERARQQMAASFKQFAETSAQLQLPKTPVDATATLTALDDQITQLKQYLCATAPAEAHALAERMRGVSVHSLAVIMAALAGTSFAHRDQLVAFCGLDVRARRSGTWQGRESISKRGNAYVRKVLFHIAWGLARHHAQYRQYYDRLRAKGKHYFTCLIAIARKFLRFFFAFYCQHRIPLSAVV